MRWLLLAALCGCGRIDFDVSVDGDSTSDSSTDVGLLVHLAFDSDGLLLDRVGNNVTCFGPCPTSAPGRVGDGAAAFDGTQCLSIADSPAFHTPTTLTVTAWGNAVTPTQQYAQLVSRPFGGPTQNTNSYELWVGPTNLWVSVLMNTVLVSNPVPPQTWHHTALVFDGVTETLYLDGQFVDSSAAMPLQFTADPTTVGCDIDFGSAVFHITGMIDDVRIYARALSVNEVQTIVAL